MAKCVNCGKNFDYEKYYGICPKCGTYNREESPQEEHRALHERYDSTGQEQPHGQQPGPSGTAQGFYGQHGQAGPAQGRYTAAPWPSGPARQKPVRAKATPGQVLIFILLIVGIVGTVVFPILYMFGKSVKLGMTITEAVTSQKEAESGETTEPEDYPRQTAPVVTRTAGEVLYLGSEGDLAVTVGAARVRVLAGYAEDFPEGEKLVAISVTYQEEQPGYTDYEATDMLYVGFGDTYRACLTSYDMEPYLGILGSIRMVDRYTIAYGEGEGDLLVFVPEEVNSLNLYIESRDQDTYELLEIFEIPLEIGPGEEI